MESEIRIYSRQKGQIQRVQVVKWDDWSKLDFLYLKENPAALQCFRDIYANYLVPGCPWVFGNMILFHLPRDLNFDFSYESKKYGKITDKLTAATIALKEGVIIMGGRPIFKNKTIRELWKCLEDNKSVFVVCGKLPFTKVIPVGGYAGYLSEQEINAVIKVNSSFFVMDSFDCATVYDHVGKIFGLCVKDGVVESPPLYRREALLVKKDGQVVIEELDIRDMKIKIGEKCYLHGQNATVYTRPDRKRTPYWKCGKQVVIVGKQVVAVKEKGRVFIPASGFVLCMNSNDACEENIMPGDRVEYHGLEDIQFGIQVGNSMVRDGIITKEFVSKFYNIRKLEKIPYPPSLYPMDFENGRAARIGLGCDQNHHPVLFWAEGAGKLQYVPGVDSTGASLMEMGQIAKDLGLINAVNLDGGGSAQILIDNIRSLRISDRNEKDNSDAERLVPLGLVVR